MNSPPWWVTWLHRTCAVEKYGPLRSDGYRLKFFLCEPSRIPRQFHFIEIIESWIPYTFSDWSAMLISLATPLRIMILCFLPWHELYLVFLTSVTFLTLQTRRWNWERNAHETLDEYNMKFSTNSLSWTPHLRPNRSRCTFRGEGAPSPTHEIPYRYTSSISMKLILVDIVVSQEYISYEIRV